VLAEARHPLSVLVAPHHPLTRLKRVALSDCIHFPLAVPDHSLAARILLDLAMEEASLTLRPSLESDSIETLKAFARLGDAVCLSFRLGDQECSPGLVSLALTDARCSEANLYLAMRRGRVLPVAAASFAQLLEDQIRDTVVSPSVSVA
jgi:DNA-binding transcriptional LysR family regulator